MTAIKKIKDKEGTQFYPVTHERAVRDDNGVTLETKLQNINSKVDNNYTHLSGNHTYTSAQSHLFFSSLPLRAGDKIRVRVNYNVSVVSGWLYGRVGTSSSLWNQQFIEQRPATFESGKYYIFTLAADTDILGFRLYTYSEDVTISLSVDYGDISELIFSVSKEIEDVKEDVTDTQNDLAITDGKVSSLQIGLSDTNDKVGEVDSKILDAPIYKTDRLGFDFQQFCLFHDNFHRTISSELWKIGTNGDASHPMDYTSLRDDYASVDDGFRIVDDILQNDRSVAITNSFRILDGITLTCPFIVELASIKTNDHETDFVVNLSDKDNYTLIRFSRTSSNAFNAILWQCVEGVLTRKMTISQNYEVNNGKFIVYENRIEVYAGDLLVNTLFINTDPSNNIGLMVANDRDIECRGFSVYNIRKKLFVSTAQAIDNNVSLDYLIGSSGNQSRTLSSLICRNSRYSEKFEVEKSLCNSSSSDRAMTAIRSYTVANLRKYRVSFDVYLDYEDNEIDYVPEVIFQSADPLPNGSRRPQIALRTDGKYLYVTTGTDTINGDTENPIYESEQVCNVRLKEWMHIELYVKEGYEDFHNPVILLSVDGKHVFSNFLPNVYNEPVQAKLTYGIYAAKWLPAYRDETNPDITKRTIYIDNFFVEQ